ncbi:tripartite tricarboxylate transporter substrate binding protein [Rhodovarius crocodyli]|uniref:Tripartite tricarboxylate transporter substrate binding protein n=1 Tax=Rhodovarius crocodyli TaxID=1979269 RepID=A0A437MM88_9PROT|nr:tripartite tricarboxylate transporter substrate binding protein [Rhodovarius crocodyli]RVT98743.1 tripartite tricarboxylate transporter substrate binding protein [Rhodovarius crocodyli]
MMPTRRHALALPGLLLAAPAFAQAPASPPADFPRKPLTLIAPFTPGGPIDILARTLAQGFQARSGQTAAVDNRAGGAGNIGIDLVRRAAPDGTTMLVIPAGNLTINPTLLRGLTFDVERDFAPVSMMATTPNIILASTQSGIRSVADLIAKAKANPGAVTYGSPGVGSQLHLAMELLRSRADIDIQHVPYRGTTQAVADLLNGQTQLLASNLPVALPLVRDGRAVPIALTTAIRTPALPDVPTLAESGFPGMDVTSWYGLLVPRATPAPVVQAISELTETVLRAPETAPVLAAQGMDVVCEAPAPFAERLKRETAMWARVIRERGITAD